MKQLVNTLIQVTQWVKRKTFHSELIAHDSALESWSSLGAWTVKVREECIARQKNERSINKQCDMANGIAVVRIWLNTGKIKVNGDEQTRQETGQELHWEG